MTTGELRLRAGRIKGMTQYVSAVHVAAEARAAAISGSSLLASCRWPFWTEAGAYFKAIFLSTKAQS